MGTNYYLMSRNKKLMREHFAVETEYDIKDIEYAIVDEPYLGYEIHLNKLSWGWRPLFQRHKTINTFKELEEFCLKNKSVISIYDEYGRRYTWKQYFERVYEHSQQKKEPRKWIYDIDSVFQNCGSRLQMYHVLKGRQKYIFRSAINNITKRKNWRGNAFMCMKDYGAKKNIGKIRIIHLIGQKVSFARRSICLCMGILIWKERQYY